MENTTTGPEIVGLFADKDELEKAVAELLAAGFERAELSLLSSHDSLDILERSGSTWQNTVTALVGEYKILGPLAASGGIFLAGGPVAGAIAGVIGAAVSGMAAKEVLEEVLAAPEADDFVRALDAGSVILWVRADGEDSQEKAQQILGANNADNIHRVEAE
ncbi:MAG: hypothetical protein HN731_08170 [Rhodospirillaceae bacterium]|jgi:hypothetical protein|nr:hypothetical protein [Rhodospirillaceae bacterium]MBT7955152.1 hypothetical protein [Rhodospirillaceae bacterium]